MKYSKVQRKKNKRLCPVIQFVVGVSVGVGVQIYVKIFKTSYFPNCMMDLVHIYVMIDIGPKFLSAVPQSMPMILRPRSQTLKFYKLSIALKFLKSSYFPNHTMDLVHIWYIDRYRLKVSFSSTPAHAHIRYDDGYRSRVLFSYTPTYDYG